MTQETFRQQCGEDYLHFIQDKQNCNRGLVPEDGFNVHHIHPIGLMGPKTDPSNMVKLTLLEHCIAHALLFKAIPRQATARALRCVATRSQYQNLTEEERNFLEEHYSWTELLTAAHKIPVTFKTKTKHSVARKGRVCMTDGTVEKMVSQEQMVDLEKQGFWRGHTDMHCRKTSNQSRGRMYVHNFIEERLIWPEESESYIETGYVVGRLPKHNAILAKSREGKCGREKGKKHSEEARRRMSQSHLGKAPANKGRIVINDGKHIRYIHPEQQQEYLEQGWSLGALPMSEERRKYLSEKLKGYRWSEESKLKKREQMKGTTRLYKEGEPKTIRVPMSEKDSYLEQGWTTVRKGTDRSSAHKRASQTRNAQRKFSKDGIRKWFNPDQFNQALSEGWVPVRPLS